MPLNINIRDGTIHLATDSILSRYLGANTICIAIYFLFLFDSIAIQYCGVVIFFFFFFLLTLDLILNVETALE